MLEDPRTEVRQLPDGQVVHLYEGYLTKLFAQHHLSVPLYTHTLRALKEMDCVRQLRRGGGGSPSQWLLVRPPERDKVEEALAPKETPVPVEAIQQEVRDQQMNDMNKRITRLEVALQRFLEEAAS